MLYVCDLIKSKRTNWVIFLRIRLLVPLCVSRWIVMQGTLSKYFIKVFHLYPQQNTCERTVNETKHHKNHVDNKGWKHTHFFKSTWIWCNSKMWRKNIITKTMPSYFANIQIKTYKSCKGPLSKGNNMYRLGTNMPLLEVNKVQRCAFWKGTTPVFFFFFWDCIANTARKSSQKSNFRGRASYILI